MASTSSLFFLAASLFMVASAAKIPATWKTCKRSLPPAEYDPCIKTAVTDVVNELTTKGAPSLGIPPIDPMKITALEIGQGSGPVAVDLKFRDLEVGNLQSVEVVTIRHKDADKMRFGADIILKKPLTVKAEYELSGKVLVLPIQGKGHCFMSLDNFRGAIDLVGLPYKKGEETHMNVTEFNANFETDRLHVKFENLFDGNKELGDNMNVFLNENWDVILKEMKPAIVEAFTQAFRAISNQIFSKISYTTIIPP